MLHDPVMLTAAAHPFEAGSTTVPVAEGMTIAEMLAFAQPDPVLAAHAVAFIDGHMIEREYWHCVRPKAGKTVEIRVLPMGGGGGGGKDTLRTVLSLAVLVTASVVPGLQIFAGLSPFQQGLLQAGIAVVGNLAINALVPIKEPGRPPAEDEIFSIEGFQNRARPFESVPQILGRRRVAPDYGARTVTEIVGQDQYLRALFVWGIGPLHIDEDSLKIGETPLSDFEDVEIENRAGLPGDAPRTLYSDTVIEDNVQVLLGEVVEQVDEPAGPQVRTAPAISDELSIDITFPGGLIIIGRKSGDRIPRSVDVRIQYRKVGDSTWLTPNFTSKTFPDSWISGNVVTFTGKRQSTVRHGMRWSVPEKGQYEVRVERLPAVVGEGRVTDATYWTALRAIEDRDPIREGVQVATTTVRIRATNQLNGTLDEFNGVVTTIGKDWTGTAWVDGQQITNPASLVRHALQGRANAVPLADNSLDLPSLEDFHEFCVEKGFECNLLIRNGRSVWEVMAEAAACGRAAPAYVNDGWGVVIDRPRPFPVSHITPRNSAQFEAEKGFSELPHAFRIPFINELEGWRQDEFRVYQPGFDISNATRFEELRLPGVTHPDQIAKLGRYRMAQAIHQPERWIFKQDMEFLTYQRGDRVKITHDVLLVGLHSGRVKSVTVDGANNVTALVLDEQVEMEAGNEYGISIRTPDDAAITRRVVTAPGLTNEVTLSTSIPPLGGSPAVARGDLFGFGLYGLETDDAQIISIRPSSHAEAMITAVPYREVIYDGDDEPIPPFETHLTPLPVLPAPNVRDVISDERMLTLANDGTLTVRVAFNVDPPPENSAFAGATLDIQQRSSGTGEPFGAAQIAERGDGTIIVSGVREAETYDFRLRWVPQGGRLPGPWSIVAAHDVVGRSTPPAGLQGLTISAFGGAAYLRWERPDEIDVQIGGQVIFRHSPAFTGATWGAANTVGDLAQASAQMAVLPLLPGTYLARVIDQGGRTSLTTAKVTTKQATVLQFAATDTIDEAPAFSGAKTGLTLTSGSLRLTNPEVAQEGVYNFAAGFDFGSVVKRRMTARIAFSSFNVSDFIDARANPIDSWASFDGDVPEGGDVMVQVRHTDDDPLASPSWSAWDRLDSGEFEARAFQFRAIVSSDSPDVNLTVSELGINSDRL
jgi:hypothetical protein